MPMRTSDLKKLIKIRKFIYARRRHLARESSEKEKKLEEVASRALKRYKIFVENLFGFPLVFQENSSQKYRDY